MLCMAVYVFPFVIFLFRRVFPNLSPPFVFVGFADRLLSPERNFRGICAFAPLRETLLFQTQFSQRRIGAKVIPEARIEPGGRLADLKLSRRGVICEPNCRIHIA
jgi:hypothetical protein